jgi:hypothetical protein
VTQAGEIRMSSYCSYSNFPSASTFSEPPESIERRYKPSLETDRGMIIVAPPIPQVEIAHHVPD